MRKLLTIMALVAVSPNLPAQQQTDFCKKWQLHQYVYFYINFDPEAHEQGDYIEFFADGSFASVDEGIKESGHWRWQEEQKSLVLYDALKEEQVTLVVKELSDTELRLLLKDEEDEIEAIFMASQR